MFKRLARNVSLVFAYLLPFLIAILALIFATADILFDVGPLRGKSSWLITLLLSTILTYILIERYQAFKALKKASENSNQIQPLLFQMKDLLRSREIEVLPDGEQVYLAIPRIIDQVEGEKRIWLGALHGHSGKRISELPDSLAYKSFIAAVSQCINERGPTKWHFQEVYNITNEERLDMIVDRMRRFGAAVDYQVRAYLGLEAPSALLPLIIGEGDLIVGVDDERHYIVSRGIHVRDREAVKIAEHYFRSLWNEAPYRLRTATGIDDETLKVVRREIKRRSQESRLTK